MPDQPIATHPHEDHQKQRPDPVDTIAAAQHWAAGFGSAPLVPAEAAELASSALGITSAVTNAARRLDWQTPDAFTAVLRRAEKSNDR